MPDSLQYTSLTVNLKISKIQWIILLHSLPEFCVQFSSFDFPQSHFPLLNSFSKCLSPVVLVQLIAFSVAFSPFIYNHYSVLFPVFAFTYINIIWYLAIHQFNMECNSVCWEVKITLWLGLEKRRIVVRGERFFSCSEHSHRFSGPHQIAQSIRSATLLATVINTWLNIFTSFDRSLELWYINPSVTYVSLCKITSLK
jgi:hypothetical protein